MDTTVADPSEENAPPQETQPKAEQQARLLEPEFYHRAAGLPGRIQIRLYDATKPEDDTPAACTCWR